MFYEPHARPAELRHDPFKAMVAPRPIGWISTMSRSGRVNLAPYSYFNAVSASPPMVVFSSEGRKDTLRNIEETPEFVCNLATYALREAMNATSSPAPPGTDEFELAGLTKAPSRLVRPPRVAETPIALECRLLSIQELNDLNGRPTDRWIVFGQVVGIHVDDALLQGGRLSTAAAGPIARLGYDEYSVVDDVFALKRPGSS